MTENKTKLLIIGSGPAGYTAAIYAARANLNPHLVSGLTPGGQLTITTDVENYPGYENVIQGPWLMEQMASQAKKVGTVIHDDIIKEVDFSKKPFLAIGESNKQYIAESVIISTGAQARWLKIKGEDKFKGYGISACDGFFFKDKEVAVIGGGNTAAEEALFLTNFASKVNIIHRRDSLRSEKILQERLFKNPKIKIHWNKIVKEFKGKDSPRELEKIIISDIKNNSQEEMDINGVFIAIGHDPATKLFLNKLKMDDENYILTKPDSTETSVEGIYAAGDVKDNIYRQAVTAAGMGCMAALEAEKYLSNKN